MEAILLIGIDTNVLVRLIMRDDEAQYQKAHSFIAKMDQSYNKGFINLIVLSELSFLLLRTYKIPKEAFISILMTLCRKSFLLLEKESAVLKALETYKSVNADFHDVLISFVNQQENIDSTVTFDKKAATRVMGFELL